MFFCYVDESGDAGFHDVDNPQKTGSRYFILSALVIDADKWKEGLNTIKNFRHQLAAQAYLNYDVEFHNAEMIDPRRTAAYSQLSVSDRWNIIRQVAEKIGKQISCSKVVNTHVRKLMATGATGQTIPGVRIGWILEDPFYRNSHDSLFIQAADMIAYTLKEQEFPLTARKKFNADRIFKNLLIASCYSSSNADEDNIIRL